MNTAIERRLGSSRESSEPSAHPYDYYWTPGQELRPPPGRVKNTPRYFHARKFMLGDLRDVKRDSLPQIRGEYVDRYNDQFWEGDELMDNVVTAMKSFQGGTGKGRAAFDQALREGINSLDNPPEAFIALFRQLDTEPEWLDWDRVDRGARIFSNLPGLYKTLNGVIDAVFTTNSAAVSLATGATGRFVRQKENRFIESLTLFTTMSAPGGMQRYGEGFKTGVHIRLMHAFVRRALSNKEGLYEYDFHGNPISSADSIPAGPLFGIGAMLVMRAFGIEVRRDEMEDVDMLWRYMMYVMGVNPLVITQNLEESLFSIDYFFATLGEPSQYSDEMNRVFFQDIRESIKERCDTRRERFLTEFAFTQILGAFAWHMFGEELCLNLKYVRKPSFLARLVPKGVTLYNKLTSRDASYDLPYNEGYDPDLQAEAIKKILKANDKEAEVTFQSHDKTDSDTLIHRAMA